MLSVQLDSPVSTTNFLLSLPSSVLLLSYVPSHRSMNIFFNISHPAHVHFFKHTMTALMESGHQVVIGARNKEFTVDLLQRAGFEHQVLTSKGSGFLGLVLELAKQQFLVGRIVRRHKIDMLLQIGGIFNAPVSWLMRRPALAVSDTENDRWGNQISFNMSRHLLVPSCFDHGAGGEWRKQIHYPGYHELAYLAPRFLKKPVQVEDKILVRFVGWGAGHDIGETSLSDSQKVELVRLLQKSGQVFISSEGPLPAEIADLECTFHPADIHDFMQTCKLLVGESATMASECAVLGIPALFISNTGRGYTTEQDEKYDLIRHYRINQWTDIMATLEDWTCRDLQPEWQAKRQTMLADKIDVTAWLLDVITQYPESVSAALNGDFSKYSLCAE